MSNNAYLYYYDFEQSIDKRWRGIFYSALKNKNNVSMLQLGFFKRARLILTETSFSISDSKDKSDGIPQFEVKFGVEEWSNKKGALAPFQFH